MKSAVIFAFTLMMASSLFAQLPDSFSTIIKYKDGSVFQGEVVKEDPSFITMVVSTGDTITIRKIFIKKRTVISETASFRRGGKYHYNSGFFGSTNLSQALSEDPSTQLNLMGGIRLNEKYSVALGAGLHFNTITDNSRWRNNDFLAIYGYGRRYLNTSNWGPFIAAKAGYGFPIRDDFFFDDYSGGFYAEPSIGFHFASRRKVRYLVSLSQYVQYTNSTEEFTDQFANPVRLEYNTWFFRPVLAFGIEFR